MRPWHAIPIVGLAAGALAVTLGVRGVELACAALAAAAITHAVRALAGDTPAALAGAIAGGLLAVVAIAEHGALARQSLAVPWLAVAAAAWTFAELARPTATPYVALAPAITAAILEPACVALPAIVGARLVGPPSKEAIEAALRAQLPTEPAWAESGQLPLPIERSRSGAWSSDKSRPTQAVPVKGSIDKSRPTRAVESGPVKGSPDTSRPTRAASKLRAPRRVALSSRWTIAVPIAGAVLVVIAIVAGTARDGSLAALADAWYGTRVRDAAALDALTRLADALGPLLIVAGAGGLAVLARIHLASLAIVACAIGAVLVDLRAGAPGTTALGLAALCAGAGIARLAGTIRIRSGQAITAATCGAMLLVPPLWTLIG